MAVERHGHKIVIAEFFANLSRSNKRGSGSLDFAAARGADARGNQQ
jgi:hypothetical protein